MSIREKDKLDLELMSYTDIAYEIIKEDKKQYNTPNLFREVCNLLELSEAEFEAKIGDFFTALTRIPENNINQEFSLFGNSEASLSQFFNNCAFLHRLSFYFILQ